MTRLFRKYSICFSLMLGMLLKSTIACGPFLSYDEDRFALFSPDLVGKGGLENFYYTERLFNSILPDPMQKDYHRNCQEWLSVCGATIKEEDIYNVEYEMSPDSFFIQMNTKEENKNTFQHWLSAKKNRAYLDYMYLAKESEYIQFGNLDPWEDGISNKNYDSLLLQSANNFSYKYRNTNSSFLKKRYAFQCLKSQYYLWKRGYNTYKDSISQIYNTELKDSSSILYGWSQLYYGMTKDGNEKTKLLLESFDHSESKKFFCYNTLNKEDIETLELSTSSIYYKSLCIVFRTINSPDKCLSNIEKIYSLDPNNKYLAFLMSREINKIENWIWSPKYLGFNVKADNAYYSRKENSKKTYAYYEKINLIKDLDYVQQMRSFLYRINTSNYIFHNICNLATIHLENIGGNYSIAMKLIEQTKYFSKNTVFEQQRIVEQIIAYANLNNLNESNCQSWILTQLKTLEKMNPRFLQREEPDYGYYSKEGSNEQDDDLFEVILMLSRRFQALGNTMVAGLLYNMANITTDEHEFQIYYNDHFDPKKDTGIEYYQIQYFDDHGTENTVDSLLAFQLKPNKSAFEKYISVQLTKPDFYKDLKGTMLMRNQKYKEAYDIFKTIDTGFWKNNYAFTDFLPSKSLEFLGSLTPWDHRKNTLFPALNKAIIAQEICQLYDKMALSKEDESRAQCAILIANYQYNLTSYGKGWMMLQYYNTCESSNEISIRALKSAIKNYQFAYKTSHNTETRATAFAMLHYCNKLLGRYYNDQGDVQTQSIFLSELRKRYKNTQVFKLAETHCPDFK